MCPIQIVVQVNATDQGFNLIFHTVRQLVSIFAKKFDAVVIERIMRCGDHDACLKFQLLCQIGNPRRGHDTCQDGLSPCRAYPRGQCGLKHRSREARVPTDQERRRLSFFTMFFPKIECCRPPELIGQLRRQFEIRFAPDAVGAKKSRHVCSSPAAPMKIILLQYDRFSLKRQARHATRLRRRS